MPLTGTPNLKGTTSSHFYSLRPRHPIEAAWIVGPLRVGERKWSAAEGDGLQWRPARVAEIAARLYHGDEVAAPCDAESKLIGPQAKAARLDLCIPQHGWNIAKRVVGPARAPAGGAWQIIDGYILIPSKCTQAGVGGIALEIDSPHDGAAGEGMVADAGDTAGDRDVGQAGAERERRVPDAGDAAAYRHPGQDGAEVERPVPDAGDAVGNRDAGQACADARRRCFRCR